MLNSISETGHVRNVRKLESLISFCQEHGKDYTPSNPNLTVEALQTIATQCTQALIELTNAKTELTTAKNERQITFSSLKSTATRIISVLTSSGASAEIIADARSINRKLQGRRATPKPEPSSDKKTISSSQQSFDYKQDYFFKLITLINAEPTYAPLEEELKIATLQAYCDKLKKQNLAVINAYTTYSNAMKKRDKLFYINENSLVNTAQQVKAYIKGKFGVTSIDYKQIRGIYFKKK